MPDNLIAVGDRCNDGIDPLISKTMRDAGDVRFLRGCGHGIELDEIEQC